MISIHLHKHTHTSAFQIMRLKHLPRMNSSNKGHLLLLFLLFFFYRTYSSSLQHHSGTYTTHEMKVTKETRILNKSWTFIFFSCFCYTKCLALYKWPQLKVGRFAVGDWIVDQIKMIGHKRAMKSIKDDDRYWSQYVKHDWAEKEEFICKIHLNLCDGFVFGILLSSHFVQTKLFT